MRQTHLPTTALLGLVASLCLSLDESARCQEIPLEDAIRKFSSAADQTGEEPDYPATLWQAIETEHLGAMEEYLNRQADLREHHPRHGRTPLAWATAWGHTDAVRLLFDYGADPNARNRDGSTPLHDAALTGRSETAEVLLDHGADPNRETYRGVTPLETARLPWNRARGNMRRLGLALQRREVVTGRREVIRLLRSRGARDDRSRWRLFAALLAIGFSLMMFCVFLFQVGTCLALTIALHAVPRVHRQVSYWQIWLLIIPCLAAGWNFFVFPRLSRSFVFALGAQRQVKHNGAGSLGFWFCVMYLGSWIPLINIFCMAASVVLLMLYLIQLIQHSRVLQSQQVAAVARQRRTSENAPAAGNETTTSPLPVNALNSSRRYDLDALRGVAMLLGIGLHGAMSFGVGPWFIQDPRQNDAFRWLFSAVHGFRMPLFFLLSGFFTAMLWRQRGLRAMLWQRFCRVALPLAVATLVVIPVLDIASLAAWAGTTSTALRLEAEQYRSPTIGENSTDKTSTTGYQGPGLLDFDGLIASYGLFGFVLFYVPVFHHLWFLWFLCWLVALFAAFASVADKFAWKAPPCWLISGPLRYLWLLPLTMLFQSVMVMRLPWFGPDTSPGLLPAPHVLGYFAVFFGFGALYYGSDDEAGRLGKWWWLHLAIGLLVVFPYGMSRPDLPRPVGVGLQVIYTWSMSFGMLGFCHRYVNRENRLVRYLSDASYWLYLTHLPLVVLGQWWVYSWQWPAVVKFLAVTGISTAVLLVIYHLLVRYTWVGTALNGPRFRVARVGGHSSPLRPAD